MLAAATAACARPRPRGHDRLGLGAPRAPGRVPAARGRDPWNRAGEGAAAPRACAAGVASALSSPWRSRPWWQSGSRCWRATKIEQSRESVRAGDLDQALDSARDAHGLQPYAATPKLQEAQVLELRDELAQAAAAARRATEAEATNWKTWLILSRIQAKREHTSSSIRALQHARELNPSSPLFNQVGLATGSSSSSTSLLPDVS